MRVLTLTWGPYSVCTRKIYGRANEAIGQRQYLSARPQHTSPTPQSIPRNRMRETRREPLRPPAPPRAPPPAPEHPRGAGEGGGSSCGRVSDPWASQEGYPRHFSELYGCWGYSTLTLARERGISAEVVRCVSPPSAAGGACVRRGCGGCEGEEAEGSVPRDDRECLLSLRESAAIGLVCGSV